MDFVSGLPRTQRNHDAITKSAHFWAIIMDYSPERLAELYINEIVRLHGIPVSIVSDRNPRTPLYWNEVGERKLMGSEIVRQTEDKVNIIKDRLKIASYRQKSYAELERRDIEYQAGDKVFLKVSPWKKYMIFGQKGKLSPRFIGPYEVLERVGAVAYKLALPPELDKIHNVFHVSMLRRYRSDPCHVLPIESVEVNPDLTYEEEPIQILARELKEIRNKSIP
ncbi:PREDICTED: uncharacterized protein LOC109236024 [Nicotiana attenuata]|uniref:uncharacterized protein LOC109236024 n=1 Tax=Nicotiana attenuata TaxID=49451 RepID=UPI0009050981|nr:PREDICTED: uncharacterized protein LOC109236024 [Nicotiana attenuata]